MTAMATRPGQPSARRASLSEPMVERRSILQEPAPLHGADPLRCAGAQDAHRAPREARAGPPPPSAAPYVAQYAHRTPREARAGPPPPSAAPRGARRSSRPPRGASGLPAGRRPPRGVAVCSGGGTTHAIEGSSTHCLRRGLCARPCAAGAGGRRPGRARRAPPSSGRVHELSRRRVAGAGGADRRGTARARARRHGPAPRRRGGGRRLRLRLLRAAHRTPRAAGGDRLLPGHPARDARHHARPRRAGGGPRHRGGARHPHRSAAAGRRCRLDHHRRRLPRDVRSRADARRHSARRSRREAGSPSSSTASRTGPAIRSRPTTRCRSGRCSPSGAGPASSSRRCTTSCPGSTSSSCAPRRAVPPRMKAVLPRPEADAPRAA